MMNLLAQPIIFNIIIVIASIFILFKAADYLIIGISSYAKKLGLSDAIIGLIVVAFAASLPEMIASIAGFTKEASVGFGAILGSNMVHAGLALGVLAVFAGKMPIEKSVFQKHKLILWLFLMLPFVLLIIDGELGRIDGVILITVFVIYISRLIYLESKTGKVKEKVKIKRVWKDAAVFLGCLTAMILSGRYLVFSSVNLAHEIGVPAYFISLTVIAIGATMPDLAVEIKSIFKGHSHIGLGDLMGSLMIELLLFFGVVALINPIKVNLTEIMNALIFLMISITAIVLFMRGKTITWKQGIILLGLYAAFMMIEVVKMI
ncbi:hypothetical protein DRJ25_01895 [Candidatus Woesearchaeota archaeon]|nr:MAG: hypothetical protein DRJ25_01895 [Candidatus Woesearchaeota archaeon]